MQNTDFLSAEEVARYLHLGKNTVYQLAKSGEIASYRMGRKLRFTREDVDSYLAAKHRSAASWAMQSFPVEGEPSGADDEDELVHAASFGAASGIPFVIAGNDVAAGIIVQGLNDSGIAAECKPCESYTALVDLYAGAVSAAVVHLYDQASNSCNVPYVQRLVPGISVEVIRLYGRYQGLIVRQGNPKKLTSWGALLREGVRLSNRPKGSGARILLDGKLRAMEARSETIDGYDTPPSASMSAVRHVAAGLADATVGTQREARGIEGVQFIPLQVEWVDLAIRKSHEAKPAIRAIESLLGGAQLRADLQAVGADDVTKLGSIVFES